MSRIRLTERAQNDLTRLYQFLEKVDVNAADEAIDTIVSALDLLVQMPLSAALVEGRNDIRKFVIAYGQSGYLAFYEYDYAGDIVIVATIMHQKEQYFFDTVGKNTLD